MRLKSVLGPVQLVFYGVGVIVGAGVYSVIGGAVAIAQESLWLSFSLAALVAFLTALSYAEMATTFPAAGAEYVYLQHAAPRADWAPFLVGMTILLGGGATAATVAIAFGGYLRTFVDVPTGLSALALLAACTAINIWGIRESSWANMAFTAIEVGGLVLVIFAGLQAENFAQPVLAAPQPGVIAAAAILFFVFLGFEEIANVAEEVRDPARDIPRAIFWGLGITTVLYVLVSLAVVALATPAELAASQAPLAVALEKAWPRGGTLLSAIALFATANTVLITLIAASRLAFSMARDRELPPLFARLLPGRRTPWVGAGLALAVSAILLPVGNLTLLAGLSSFAALLAFLAVNLTLILARYREPRRPRPFRVPFSIGRLPILPVAAIVSIVVLLVHFEPAVYYGGAAALVLSSFAFLVRKYWAR